MIRIANRNDMPRLLELLTHYYESDVLANIKVENDETARKVLTTILVGGGLGIVGIRDNKIQGMILAIKTPWLWDNNKYIISEIAYWVEPEYRNTTLGYRLLQKYTELCNELKIQEKIQNFTISQMNGQKFDYSRFGYKPIETTWSI